MRVRLGRFDFQIKVILVLLALFLAALNLLNLALLGRARGSLERAERGRSEALARDAVSTLRLQEDPSVPGVPQLRRMASRLGVERIAVLDPVGREIEASAVEAVGSWRLQDLSPDERAALLAGRAVSGPLRRTGGWQQVTFGVFVPVLDPAGTIRRVVQVEFAVPELGALEKDLRLVLAIQIGGILLLGALVLLFANWVSRPYRRIAAAAGEAGLTAAKVSGAEPDELADAFRNVVAKLRDQDEALGALTKEKEGLGDLVRFATRSARGMSTGVLVVERRGRVAAMNPAAALLLGASTEEGQGKELGRVASKVTGLGDRVLACLADGKGASREVLAVRGEDGSPGHLGVSISPVFGAEAEPAGALVLMTDLTEIRKIREQVRLRESLVEVGQLSAGIAHEVRNALGTILGWARMLEKQESPRVRGPAREIVKEVDSVRASLEEFLLYARPPEPSRVLVGLEALIRSAAAAAERVDVDVQGEFGAVLGDEGLLRRVFGNLIENAAQAGAETGRRVKVRISGKRVRQDRILQVEVEDDGPGIPAEKRPHVFRPFFTTRARGTGLGLALVQRTMVDLGGTVEVVEGSLGGALFRLRFPMAPSAEPALAGKGV